MAITPQEAFRPRPEDERIAAMLEERIDKALRGLSEGGSVCVDLPYETSEKARRLLIHTYSEAGWKVSCESDQRDGDYLRFSA